MSTSDIIRLCQLIFIRDPLQPDRSREMLPCPAGRWLSEAVPADCHVGDWVAVDGGRVLARQEWDTHILVPGAEIVLYPRLRGTIGKIVSGVVFPPLGVYWALRHVGMPTWASGLLTGGLVGMQAFPTIENMMAGRPTAANVPTSSSDLQSSNTYGFSGITNGTRIGAPIPVVYGEHRVGGQLIAAQVKTESNNDVLNLLYAVSEGEVLAIGSVHMNQQPVENFSGVSLEARTGLITQSPITLFDDKAGVTYDADALLTTSFITYTTIGSNINAVEVKLTFPGGLFLINDNGDFAGTDVFIEVDYKLSAFGTWTTGPRQRIRKHTRTVIRETIRVDSLPSGQYDIRVRRTTAESTSTKRVDTVRREAITELVNDNYTYPHTALLAVRAVATNQLSGGLPRVTCLLHGVRVKGWSTELLYQEVYSRNPAWVVFDMLTNERYGHGRFTWKKLHEAGTLSVTNGSVNFTGSGTGWTASTLRKGDVLHVPSLQAIGIVATINYGAQSGTLAQAWTGSTQAGAVYAVRSNDLDIQSFLDWAVFCDELVPNGIGGTEPRATCDFVFDADRENIWAAVQRICLIGQASPIKSGSYIRIKIEKPSVPVQLFTMANITADSFEEIFLSLKDRSNIFEVQYLNASNGYAQDMIVLEDALLTTNSEQPRRKTISGYGITRSSHAARLARFNQKVNRYVTRTITFEAALDAVACEPGDVIRFQHDIPQWGFGGRALAGSSSTTIVLDRSVTIETAKTYEILVRHDDDTVETATVTTPPGTVSTLAISGSWEVTPVKGEVWAFGETLISTKPFRIMSIERTQDLAVRITAVEYNAAVYDDSAVSETNQVQYSALEDMTGPPKNVKDLTMLEQIDATQSIWVSWSPPGSPHYKAGRVYRTDSNGTNVLLGESATGAFPISGIPSGEVVRVLVTSVSTAGVESSVLTAPTAEIVRGILNPPDVQALVLEGERLRWDYTPPADHAGFLVRFRPGNSTDWEAATPAHESVLRVTDFQIFKRTGTQTYLVKAVDVAGNQSLTAKALTVVYDGVIIDNIVLTDDHRALGWPGTITDGSIISGDIKADASAVFWTEDSAPMWSPSSLTLMWTAAFSRMTYEFTVEPTSAQLDAMLKLQITMAGLWSIEYQADSSAVMWQSDATALMWGSADVAMWSAVGPYMQWPGQIDHLRRQPYKIRVIGYAGTVQAVLQELSVIFDVPDLLETINAAAISALGTRLALTKSYREIISVRTMLLDDAGAAAYAKVMDKNAALGPLVKVFDKDGVATTGLVDAIVHGY